MVQSGHGLQVGGDLMIPLPLLPLPPPPLYRFLAVSDLVLVLAESRRPLAGVRSTVYEK